MMANKGLQKARACLNWVPQDPEEIKSLLPVGPESGSAAQCFNHLATKQLP